MKLFLLISSLLGITSATLVVEEVPYNQIQTRGSETEDESTVTFEAGTPIPPVVPEPRQVQPQPRAGWETYSMSSSSVATWYSTSYPNIYPAGEETRYFFSSPAGTAISINCTDFNVYCGDRVSTGDCMYLSKAGDPDFNDGVRACGSGAWDYTSTSNRFALMFLSRSSRPQNVYRFQCRISIVSPSSSSSSSSTTAAPTTVKPVAPAPAPVSSTTTTKAPATTSSSNCTCGVRKESARIVGGTEAKPNEFPWRCGLVQGNSNVFCGSSLISPNYVLTAAHCCDGMTTSNLYVTCGAHDQTKTSTTSKKTKISEIKMHPSYNSKTQDNDYCLLKFATPITYTNEISPVCLPFHKEGDACAKNITVTSSGWGTLSSGGSQPSKLQKVDLPCMSTTACKNFPGYSSSITDNMICTYAPGTDTCQGDSGGSIDYKNPGDSKYYCMGVVSWGVGCAGKNNPGVYAKTQNALSWIKSTTGDNFCGA